MAGQADYAAQEAANSAMYAATNAEVAASLAETAADMAGRSATAAQDTVTAAKAATTAADAARAAADKAQEITDNTRRAETELLAAEHAHKLALARAAADLPDPDHPDEAANDQNIATSATWRAYRFAVTARVSAPTGCRLRRAATAAADAAGDAAAARDAADTAYRTRRQPRRPGHPQARRRHRLDPHPAKSTGMTAPAPAA